MYGQNTGMRFGGPLTPTVKKLLIINGVIFLIQTLAGLFPALISQGTIEHFFGLSHAGIFSEFKIWQVFTYMFIHGGFLHIGLNMLVLFMFGGELELLWGNKFFLKYYLYSGIGAGLFIILMNYVTFLSWPGNANSPTLGASGAIYGILLAYALYWPNREILLFPFFIPIKVKYVALVIGLIAFLGTMGSCASVEGGVSHIGHLGGIISGYILLKLMKRSSGSSSFAGSSQSNNSNIVSDTLKKARLKKKKKEIETRIKAKKIIDDLLEKIAREGMSSLTPEERKQLEWARKHYYPEGNDIVH
ncbi:MAG: rhomboid family intramembrane serine protease [bacterium]|nr:rhomboid family intramembrane serine protease [bacterium]